MQNTDYDNIAQYDVIKNYQILQEIVKMKSGVYFFLE